MAVDTAQVEQTPLPLSWREASQGIIAGPFAMQPFERFLTISTVVLETSSMFCRLEDRPQYWRLSTLNGEALYYEQERDDIWTRLVLAECQWCWETPE